MNVAHVIVHTPEQVSEIVNDAWKIADVYAEDSERWAMVFVQACRLLGQRATIAAQPAPVPALGVDLNGLRAR